MADQDEAQANPLLDNEGHTDHHWLAGDGEMVCGDCGLRKPVERE